MQRRRRIGLVRELSRIRGRLTQPDGVMVRGTAANPRQPPCTRSNSRGDCARTAAFRCGRLDRHAPASTHRGARRALRGLQPGGRRAVTAPALVRTIPIADPAAPAPGISPCAPPARRSPEYVIQQVFRRRGRQRRGVHAGWALLLTSRRPSHALSLDGPEGPAQTFRMSACHDARLADPRGPRGRNSRPWPRSPPARTDDRGRPAPSDRTAAAIQRSPTITWIVDGGR